MTIRERIVFLWNGANERRLLSKMLLCNNQSIRENPLAFTVLLTKHSSFRLLFLKDDNCPTTCKLICADLKMSKDEEKERERRKKQKVKEQDCIA